MILVGFATAFFLGASGLLGVHRRLAGAHAAAQLALNRLEAECGRRGDLLGRMVEAVRVFMHPHREVLEGVLARRKALALAMGEALARPSDAAGFQQWYARERDLVSAFEVFQNAAVEYSELKSARNILQIAGELESVWERVDLFERAYNECSLEFNELWNGMVTGLVARFLGYAPVPVLEGAVISLEKDNHAQERALHVGEPDLKLDSDSESAETGRSGGRVFYG